MFSAATAVLSVPMVANAHVELIFVPVSGFFALLIGTPMIFRWFRPVWLRIVLFFVLLVAIPITWALLDPVVSILIENLPLYIALLAILPVTVTLAVGRLLQLIKTSDDFDTSRKIT